MNSVFSARPITKFLWKGSGLPWGFFVLFCKHVCPCLCISPDRSVTEQDRWTNRICGVKFVFSTTKWLEDTYSTRELEGNELPGASIRTLSPVEWLVWSTSSGKLPWSWNGLPLIQLQPSTKKMMLFFGMICVQPFSNLSVYRSVITDIWTPG